MKRCYFVLMAILLTLVSVGFAACGDDEPVVNDIVGTWQYDDPEMLGDFVLLLQFTKDGKFQQVTEYIGADGESEQVAFHGKYTVSGNKLAITFDSDGDSQTIYWPYTVQGDRLTIFSDETLIFTRVKDSVIEHLLKV